MALREILAQLDTEVRGLGSVDAANAELDRYLRTLTPAEAKIEGLRVKQMQASEMASRLARKIRELQKAEGDNSKKLEELRRAYVKAREAAAGYGQAADKVRAGESATTAQTGGLVAGFRKAHVVLAAIAGAALTARHALSTFTDAIAEVIQVGAELEDTSKRLGVSSTALQEWQFIAERSDVSTEALTAAFARLARNAEAGRGPWRDLGIDVRDSNGELRSQEELFGESITALAGVENRTRRAALAQQLFGRTGNELMVLLEDGPGAVEELRDRFHELGGGLSEELVEGAAEADDAFVDLRLAMRSLRGVLAADIIPVVARVVTAIADTVGGLADLARNSSIVETVLGALIVVVGALVLALAPILIPTLLLIAAFVAIVLVVEDVVTAFRGGESVFGSFMEWLFGLVGVTISFKDAITLAGKAWDDFVRDIGETIDEVERAFSWLSGSDIAANVDVQGAPGGTALVRSAAGSAKGETTINAPSSITIEGATDPEATARAVDRHLKRRMRELVDVVPLAEGEVA
jgi:hypothetical protein